jgi:hypothetical protein
MSKLREIDSALKGFRRSEDPFILAQARRVEREAKKLRSLVSAKK